MESFDSPVDEVISHMHNYGTFMGNNQRTKTEPGMGDPLDFREFEGLLEQARYHPEEVEEEEEEEKGIKKYIKLVLPHVALVLVVVIYACLGALVFYSVESPNELQVKQEGIEEILKLRLELVATMWNYSRRGNNPLNQGLWLDQSDQQLTLFTSALYRNFKDNFVSYKDVRYKDTADIGNEDDDERANPRRYSGAAWTPASAIFFSATTMATIGYGNIVPVTSRGRIICVFFALFGAPLAIITIGDLGKFLSECTIWLYKQLKRGRKALRLKLRQLRGEKKRSETSEGEEGGSDMTEEEENDEDMEWEDLILDKTQVPVWMVFAILLLYIALGALLFSFMEDWTYVDSFYFCFITLTTVGFGDLVPRKHQYIVLMLMYIGLGLAVTTMCIDLVGITYIQKIHYFGRKFKGTDLLQLLKRRKMMEAVLAQRGDLMQLYLERAQQQESISGSLHAVDWKEQEWDAETVDNLCVYEPPKVVSNPTPSPSMASTYSTAPSIYQRELYFAGLLSPRSGTNSGPEMDLSLTLTTPSSVIERDLMFFRQNTESRNSWIESGPDISLNCSLDTTPSQTERDYLYNVIYDRSPSASSFKHEFPYWPAEWLAQIAQCAKGRKLRSCPERIVQSVHSVRSASVGNHNYTQLINVDEYNTPLPTVASRPVNLPSQLRASSPLSHACSPTSRVHAAPCTTLSQRSPSMRYASLSIPCTPSGKLSSALPVLVELDEPRTLIAHQLCKSEPDALSRVQLIQAYEILDQNTVACSKVAGYIQRHTCITDTSDIVQLPFQIRRSKPDVYTSGTQGSSSNKQIIHDTPLLLPCPDYMEKHPVSGAHESSTVLCSAFPDVSETQPIRESFGLVGQQVFHVSSTTTDRSVTTGRSLAARTRSSLEDLKDSNLPVSYEEVKAAHIEQAIIVPSCQSSDMVSPTQRSLIAPYDQDVDIASSNKQIIIVPTDQGVDIVASTGKNIIVPTDQEVNMGSPTEQLIIAPTDLGVDIVESIGQEKIAPTDHRDRIDIVASMIGQDQIAPTDQAISIVAPVQPPLIAPSDQGVDLVPYLKRDKNAPYDISSPFALAAEIVAPTNQILDMVATIERHRIAPTDKRIGTPSDEPKRAPTEECMDSGHGQDIDTTTDEQLDEPGSFMSEEFQVSEGRPTNIPRLHSLDSDYSVVDELSLFTVTGSEPSSSSASTSSDLVFIIDDEMLLTHMFDTVDPLSARDEDKPCSSRSKKLYPSPRDLLPTVQESPETDTAPLVPEGLSCMEAWMSFKSMEEESLKTKLRLPDVTIDEASSKEDDDLDPPSLLSSSSSLEDYSKLSNISSPEHESVIEFPIEINRAFSQFLDSTRTSVSVDLEGSTSEDDDSAPEEDQPIYHRDVPVYRANAKPVQTESAIQNVVSCPVKYLSKAPPQMVTENFCFVVDGDSVPIEQLVADQTWWNSTGKSTCYYFSTDLRQFKRVQTVRIKDRVISAKIAHRKMSGILEPKEIPLCNVFKVHRMFSYWRTCSKFHRIVSTISPILGNETLVDFKQRIFVQYLWRDAKEADKIRVALEFVPTVSSTLIRSRSSLAPPRRRKRKSTCSDKLSISPPPSI